MRKPRKHRTPRATVSKWEIGALRLWTDGAFWFTQKLGFGWVAERNGVIEACKSGPVKNDGTNNFASEAFAILDAIQWAYERGLREAVVCMDFVSMPQHLKRRGDDERRHAVRLYDWLTAHPDFALKLVKVSGAEPMHYRAHQLAREGAAAA